MLKVNTDNEYKAVERVYSGSTEIDKILDKNGNVLFAVNKEVEGTPALTYKGKEETNLKNYRIYGNTVNGESVGDLITEGEHAGEYKVPVTVEGKNLWNENIEILSRLSKNNDIYIFDTSDTTAAQVIRLPFAITKDSTYTISFDAQSSADSIMVVDGQPDSLYSGIEPDAAFLVTEQETSYSITRHLKAGNTNIRIFRSAATSGRNNTVYISKIQLEYGGAATPFEPYRTPVTTNIYLPEPIKIVGDEAEYIDYAEQKQHFADGTSTDVLLPALPTLSGTNTLTVGTGVQPSSVYVKGRIKEVL